MTLRWIVPAFAVLLSAASTARPARAQVTYFKVYTDPALTEPFYRCNAYGTVAEAFIVLTNANFVVSAVDFSIHYPNDAVWIADLPPDGFTMPGWVSIGTSSDGIAIAWGNCCMTDGSQGPFVVMRALLLWRGGCECDEFAVGGASPEKLQPSVVRAGDFHEFAAVGVHTYLNPDLCDTPVEPATWGKVKSLFR